jgi:hypothetical protein
MSNALYAAAFRHFLKQHGEIDSAEEEKVGQAVKVALDLVSALTTLETKSFHVHKDHSGNWMFKGEITRGDGESAVVTIKSKNPDELIEEVAEWATEFVIG